MLWLKAFHIVFMVTWFAGLFYLPRLFIYHLDAREPAAHERFVLMERRLLLITHIGAALTAAFGIALLWWWSDRAEGYLRQGWLHAKFALVALLIAYHVACMRLAADFRDGRNRRSSRWLRIYNELPTLVLVGAVVLVVVKPF